MIFVRVDGNEKIGSGHVMRCLAIANKLRSLGGECVFVVAEHSEMEDVILKQHFETICLEGSYSDWNQELPAFCELLKKQEPEILLIDSYFATQDYLNKVSVFTKVVIIDEHQAMPENCKMIISHGVSCNTSAYEQKFKKNHEGPILLLGPRYSPLREEFEQTILSPLQKKVKNVLVTTGATDRLNISGEIIKKVCGDFEELEFKIIVGRLNCNLLQLQNLCNQVANAHIEVTPENMMELMCECDLAVSAGGTTLIELCVCQVPTICFSFVDNQVESVRAFNRVGAMLSAGDFRPSSERFVEDLKSKLREFTSSFDLRQACRAKMANLIDGKGCERIAREILSLVQ